ncbi:redoxin domain-containing protein [Geofilum rubicundum]|uniref:Thiol:disulfide interchange protein TlpA n=1 Tax=Geofilum rubicundum JCM 15548 TaxID=1236989 RepID=A0A0E9M1G5_9BACT|nr:redoxin domain-containing protein [Geofilum rubicundum]GAO31642.1 thiol:disulfide interchange protein TlpA [Geofilum rubicundum JCM 15548]
MKQYPLILFMWLCSFACAAGKSNIQNTITGIFPPLANQEITLESFDGFNTYTIDKCRVDENGRFTLNFSACEYGMGYLMAEDNQSFIVILAEENLVLKGELLSQPETIEIVKGKENRLFGQYASEHPRREQALSAWVYLERIYRMDSLFAVEKTPVKAIGKEKQRIQEEDSAFLAGLDPQSYVSWFLPVRKLVSSVPVIAQYRTEEIPASIAAFRNMDYTDAKLYKSGLLREAIESHFWLIENSGRSLDSVYVEIKISIDAMIENLAADEEKLNEITDVLFKLLESRSLFEASEYLALKVLNEVACTVNDDLAAQLESYRTMKIGNTAPDISFEGGVLRNGQPVTIPGHLSEVEAAYKVVVFGSAHCPLCVDELSKITELYAKWESQGVEVVFVSLDAEKNDFVNFSAGFPFISFSDYKNWDTQAAMDYHVFATPTMFVLDQEQKIVLRPHSVRQLDAWVDWNHF